MPLSEAALGAILIVRSAYIETDSYEIPDWQAVTETHTTEGTPERAAWLAHLTAVVDAIEDGKKYTREFCVSSMDILLILPCPANVRLANCTYTWNSTKEHILEPWPWKR
ncbi:hypothetical protein B0H14DRAFT_3127085 [Mycena olivaceomarginata]|nr:hypothetical protein B0H14DRAFT_3127085 [Mycena olivaceomarginata]